VFVAADNCEGGRSFGAVVAPKDRARTLVPAEKSLWVFTDLTSKKAGQRGRTSATREASRLTSRFSHRPRRPRLSGSPSSEPRPMKICFALV
jgi:hypothetical protein